MFPFFQSMRTSPDFHDFKNMMDSGLKTMSASFLKTLGCMSSGPIDFISGPGFAPHLEWEGFIQPPPTQRTGDLERSRKPQVPVKSEAKNSLSISDFSTSDTTSSRFLPIRGNTVSSLFLYSLISL